MLRAAGVLQPLCLCVEVLGVSTDAAPAKQLLVLALKAAACKEPWQVHMPQQQLSCASGCAARACCQLPAALTHMRALVCAGRMLQVRRDGLQALATLGSALQYRVGPPAGAAGGAAGDMQQPLLLLRTPAVEVLIAHKARAMQVGAAANRRTSSQHPHACWHVRQHAHSSRMLQQWHAA